MAYCQKCGTEIPAGAGFCSKCGTPVNGVAQLTNTTNNEPDFDQNYFEGMRQRKIEEYQGYVRNTKISMVVGPIICIVGYLMWQQEGFLISCFSILAWIIGIFALYIGALSHFSNNKLLKKYESMTAHDLYIEKKRNSQMWQDIGNGARAANTVLNIAKLFG